MLACAMMVSITGLNANAAKSATGLSFSIVKLVLLNRSIDKIYGVPVCFKLPGKAGKRKLFFIEL